MNAYPELVAVVIEKLPDLFPKWIENANKLMASARAEEYQHIILILEKKKTWEFTSEIIEHSTTKVSGKIDKYLVFMAGLEKM